MKDVSVIILNYNSSAYTNACLASLEAMTQGCDYEVVIVDNNSEPEDAEKINPALCSRVSHFHRNRLNTGFSGGLMAGVNYAGGRYLLFLNNDCELLNDCLTLLTQFADRHTDAALLTGQMYDRERNFHHSFGYFPTPGLKWLGSGLLRIFDKKGYPRRRTEYKEALEVPLVTGSLMFVRTDVFAALGGFDTTHFLYCEEEDLALRIKKAGHKIMLIPNAKFVHFGGGSTNFNYLVEREYYISLMIFLKKHFNFFAQKSVQAAFILKLITGSFKQPAKLKLAGFLLCGAPIHKSLRYLQKIRL